MYYGEKQATKQCEQYLIEKNFVRSVNCRHQNVNIFSNFQVDETIGDLIFSASSICCS